MANQQNFLARNNLYLPLVVAAIIIPFSPIPWLALVGVATALSWFAVREQMSRSYSTIRYRRVVAVLAVLLTVGLLFYSFATIPVAAGVTLQQWILQVLAELWRVFVALLPALAHAVGSAIAFAMVKVAGWYIVQRLPQWYDKSNVWLNTHVPRPVFVLLLLSLVCFTGLTLAVMGGLAWCYLVYKTKQDFEKTPTTNFKRKLNLARLLAVIAGVVAPIYCLSFMTSTMATAAQLGLVISSLSLSASVIGILTQLVGVALIAAVAAGIVYVSLTVAGHLLQRYLPTVYGAGDRWLIRLANDPLLSVGYHSPLVRVVAVTSLVLAPMITLAAFSIVIAAQQLYTAVPT